MEFSTTTVDSASPIPLKALNKCDECGEPNTGKVEVVLGFGVFHVECTEVCPDGWLWPASLIHNGEVVLYCGGCAIAAGRADLV